MSAKLLNFITSHDQQRFVPFHLLKRSDLHLVFSFMRARMSLNVMYDEMYTFTVMCNFFYILPTLTIK